MKGKEGRVIDIYRPETLEPVNFGESKIAKIASAIANFLALRLTEGHIYEGDFAEDETMELANKTAVISHKSDCIKESYLRVYPVYKLSDGVFAPSPLGPTEVKVADEAIRCIDCDQSILIKRFSGRSDRLIPVVFR